MAIGLDIEIFNNLSEQICSDRSHTTTTILPKFYFLNSNHSLSKYN